MTLDLDVYNSLDCAATIAGLQACRVNPRLVSLLGAALIERIIALRFGGWSLQRTHLCRGLPQGSPLSPVLFNLHNSDSLEHFQGTRKSSDICRRQFTS